MKKRKKKKKKIFLHLILLFMIAIIILGTISIIIYKNLHKRKEQNESIHTELTIEAGTPITMDDILKNKEKNISIEEDLSLLTKVGTYQIHAIMENEKFNVTIHIVDTLPPTIELQEKAIYLDEELPTAEDFITKIIDESEYIIEPIQVTSKIGEQEIIITVKDIYGNTTTQNTKLTIKEDKEPPAFGNLNPITIEIGQKPNLQENVTAFDKRFGKVDFSIDDSKVTWNTPGTYEIYYKATDPLGNSTTATRKITIKPKDITYLIPDFPVFAQYPNYPNGCESIALYNLLRFYNINVTPNEIVEQLKKGAGPYRDGTNIYGGNPEIEFVGDPRDPRGYGVYQKPIIDVANKFKPGIIDYSGHSLNEVLNIVQKKIPVQVWGSINMKDTKICTSWIYPPTNEKINWICDLHSVVIVGYNSTKIYVSDSYTGKIEEYNRNQFEKMYNLFGKRAIYYES